MGRRFDSGSYFRHRAPGIVFGKELGNECTGRAFFPGAPVLKAEIRLNKKGCWIGLKKKFFLQTDPTPKKGIAFAGMTEKIDDVFAGECLVARASGWEYN